MKLNECVIDTNWDSVLDVIEQEYPELKEVIPEFYFMLNSLSDEELIQDSDLKIFVEGYFDEDYDVEKVDVTVDLKTSIETLANAEVDLVIANSRCDTDAKLLAHILVHIYTHLLVR